jgi:recombination protein RecR
MNLARPLKKLIEAFERLPGIGPKTAQRLTFYLLHVPQEELDNFADALSGLKKNTVLCSICFNVSETDPCPICVDPGRDKRIICVVEQPIDILSIERTGRYKGVYHVLHGRIDPLNNIGPEEIYIKQLLQRVTPPAGESPVTEVILATNSNMEGEATAMYLRREISNWEIQISNLPRITRLGQGLPAGADLEYADEVTLTKAIEGRRES